MMKILLGVFLTLSCVFAFDNSDDFINEINSNQNLWKAGRNFHQDTPMSEIRSLFGVTNLSDDFLQTIPIKVHEIIESDLPESFDARTKWSSCKSIKEIEDQSSCGSSWAISVASAISDRICIHSNGTRQTQISAKHLIYCCFYFCNGCTTGYPYYAWVFWETDGIVTGGPYGSNIGCQSYPFPPCEHNVEGSKPNCSKSEYYPSKCNRTCDSSDIKFKDDLTFGTSPYRIPPYETQIQAEIMNNGPVAGVFTVYSDFLHYKSGVYVKSANASEECKHAIRILGWGVENETKYWLAANSWNDEWGDKGLFKIRRGVNECGIEREVSAGLPKWK